MLVDIITIFPDYFRAVFDYGIVRRARAANLVEIKAHDLRGWTSDKHHIVDDRPFGGGDGMVLKPEPIFAAVESLTGAGNAREIAGAGTRVVLLSPQGRVFDQRVAQELAEVSGWCLSAVVMRAWMSASLKCWRRTKSRLEITCCRAANRQRLSD
jgi:tRNA (guanine37-N1)-methyltransferase